jgi:hypothetical protein
MTAAIQNNLIATQKKKELVPSGESSISSIKNNISSGGSSIPGELSATPYSGYELAKNEWEISEEKKKKLSNHRIRFITYLNSKIINIRIAKDFIAVGKSVCWLLSVSLFISCLLSRVSCLLSVSLFISCLVSLVSCLLSVSLFISCLLSLVF